MILFITDNLILIYKVITHLHACTNNHKSPRI